MAPHIDSNYFFKELTLKVAGCIELKSAIKHCFDTLSSLMPVDLMGFHQYSMEDGLFTTKVIATCDEILETNEQVSIARDVQERIEKRWATRVWIIDRLGDDPDTADVAVLLNVSDASAMLMDLTLEGEFTGIVTVANEQQHIYTKEQADLLTTLNEPIALSFVNSLRFKELQLMRDLLTENNRILKDELHLATSKPVIGANSGLKHAMEMVKQVAPTRSPVLLLGETGTGKEVIARAIHENSPRYNHPFISVNCGALSSGMTDSELFGHEKGAFTGALKKHKGRFERADGGTLFLDEIGELPPDVQVRLLRVLQEKEIDRVGGSQPVLVNTRVIAATHRNLEDLVAQGKFREDLYFRIRVFPVRIPALRERKQDIEMLLRHFIADKSIAMNRFPIPEIEPQSLKWLRNYEWPGNVRELENLVERAMILHRDGPLVIEPIDAENEHPAESPLNVSGRPETLAKVMENHIRRVLKTAQGRIEGNGGAAELLDMHPSTLRLRMRKLRIPFGRKHKNRYAG